MNLMNFTNSGRAAQASAISPLLHAIGLRSKTPDPPKGESPDLSTREAAVAWLDSMMEIGAGGVFAVVVEVTPALADLLLEMNPGNRHERSITKRIETDITEGRWQLNGETIIVSVCGHLNDGQHRLLAIKNAGVSVPALMAFGVPRDSRYSVDTGLTKTPGDLLGMRGISEPNKVAAVAGYLWQVKTYGSIPQHAGAPNVRPTKQQVQELAAEYLDLIQTGLAIVSGKPARAVASDSQLATAYVLLVDHNEDVPAVADFLKRLISGDKSGDADPIFVARERLNEERRKRTLWPSKALEIILRAWNFHRRGVTTSKIQVMGQWPTVVK